MSIIRTILPALAFVLISGCAALNSSAPVEDRDREVQEEAKTHAYAYRPPGEETGQQGGDAVVALLITADDQMKASQPVAAASSLERALRIEPRNPAIWHKLAKIRLVQGELRQAAALAAKSNSLAGQDQQLQGQNWQIIAEARRKQGDEEGARKAEERAAALGAN